MRQLVQQLAMAAAALFGCASAAAATLVVQPGDNLAQVIGRAADGDSVHIVAGDHHGQVAVIHHKRLTLRGIAGSAGARPVLHAQGRHAEGKGTLVIRDGDIRVENIEFRGARVPDGNGAGIRFERGRRVVSDCTNRLLDGPGGSAAYELETPNGAAHRSRRERPCGACDGGFRAVSCAAGAPFARRVALTHRE